MVPVNLPNESGMTPVSLFLSRCKAFSLVNVASSGGIFPVRLLKDRSRKSRFLSWLRNAGTGPDKLVQLNLRLVRSVSFVISGGIVPVRLVSFLNIRVLRKGRSPTCFGIWPEISPEKIVSALIRLVFGSQSTLYQSQQSRVVCHEANR